MREFRPKGFAAVAVLFAFLTFGLAQISRAASVKQPEISVHNLDNGLKIVVIPDHRAPVVTHMIWYKAGSADEPMGKSGIAHYLEHLMFKGTSNVPAGEFSSKIAEIGGKENAFTTTDYTGYYQKIIPSSLEMVMRYEADRMENLILTDETVLLNRYGRDRWRSNSMISLRPEVNPPDAPLSALPSVDVMTSTRPWTPQYSADPRPVLPMNPVQ